MAKPTPTSVVRKACTGCDQVRHLSWFPVRGRGYGKVCTPCLNAIPAATEMTCTQCREIKPVEEFCRNGDSYKNPCKECHRRKDRKPGSPPRKRYPAAPDGHKWCTKCGACKSLGSFPQRKVGLAAGCNECVAAHNREQYRKPEVQADRLARRRRWGSENPTWGTDWRRKNPERARHNSRAATARRRARRRGLPCEPYTITQIIERDGTRCLLGGHELNFDAQGQDPEMVTIEHLECLSWENSAGDVLSNVALACLSHNSRRGDRPHPAAARKRAELLAAEQEMTA